MRLLTDMMFRAHIFSVIHIMEVSEVQLTFTALTNHGVNFSTNKITAFTNQRVKSLYFLNVMGNVHLSENGLTSNSLLCSKGYMCMIQISITYY